MSFVPELSTELLPKYYDTQNKLINIKQPDEIRKKLYPKDLGIPKTTLPYIKKDLRTKQPIKLHSPSFSTMNEIFELRKKQGGVHLHNERQYESILQKDNVDNKEDIIAGILFHIIENSRFKSNKKKIKPLVIKILSEKNEVDKINNIINLNNLLSKQTRMPDIIKKINKAAPENKTIMNIDTFSIFENILLDERRKIKTELIIRKQTKKLNNLKKLNELSNKNLKLLQKKILEGKQLNESNAKAINKQIEKNEHLENEREETVEKITELTNSLNVAESKLEEKKNLLKKIRNKSNELVSSKSNPLRKDIGEIANSDINTITHNIITNSVLTGVTTNELIRATIRRDIITAKKKGQLNKEQEQRALGHLNEAFPETKQGLIIRNLGRKGTTIATGLVGSSLLASTVLPNIPNATKAIRHLFVPSRKDKRDIIIEKNTGQDQKVINKEIETLKKIDDNINLNNDQKFYERRQNFRKGFNRKKKVIYRKMKTRSNKNIRLINHIKLTNIINNHK
jgi:hypothetical protein